jgi:Flp pilus assembly protein protease CpaA
LELTTVSRWFGANSGAWGIAGESLKGFLRCASIGVVSFAARGLGGGDVKILAATGALAGWNLSLGILINTLGVAVVVGVSNFLSGGRIVRGLQSGAGKLYSFFLPNVVTPPQSFRRAEMPFCLALLLGLILLHYGNGVALIADWLPR